MFDGSRSAQEIERAYQAMWDVRAFQVAPHVGMEPRFRQGWANGRCTSTGAPVSQQDVRACLVGWLPYNLVIHPEDSRVKLLDLPNALVENDALEPWHLRHMRQKAASALQAAFLALKVCVCDCVPSSH